MFIALAPEVHLARLLENGLGFSQHYMCFGAK